MAAEIPASWQRRIDELLAGLPPLTDENCRRAAAIFATARPACRDSAA
jgi:hypothetical protein